MKKIENNNCFASKYFNKIPLSFIIKNYEREFKKMNFKIKEIKIEI